MAAHGAVLGRVDGFLTEERVLNQGRLSEGGSVEDDVQILSHK
jgi:hypothetical protein